MTPENPTSNLEAQNPDLTTQEFLDAFNSLFGKQPKQKKEKKKDKKKAQKPQKADQLKEFFTETHSIQKAMVPVTWKPCAIVHYIILQECANCGNTPECVGGTLVRHVNSCRPNDLWDFPRPDILQLGDLPQILIEKITPVDYCPDCLRAGNFQAEAQAELNGQRILESKETGENMEDSLKSFDSLFDENPISLTDLPEESDIEVWQRETDDSGESLIIEKE